MPSQIGWQKGWNFWSVSEQQTSDSTQNVSEGNQVPKSRGHNNQMSKSKEGS